MKNESEVQRVRKTTLDAIKTLKAQGAIPAQLSVPGAIDYLVHLAASQLEEWPTNLREAAKRIRANA